MSWRDITRALSGDVVVYPGDIRPEVVQTCNGQYWISDIHISSHSGTHVDAPAHYIEGGLSVDAIPPDILMGPARVIDLSSKSGAITREDLLDRTGKSRRILIKTAFSDAQAFESDYPYLTKDAARYLLDSGVVLIGTDTPSVEIFEGEGDLHRLILGKGCVIIELLDLSGIREGDYEMAALPLRLRGGDGAPARVMIRPLEGR